MRSFGTFLFGSRARALVVIAAIACALVASGGIAYGIALGDTGYSSIEPHVLIALWLILAIVLFFAYCIVGTLINRFASDKTGKRAERKRRFSIAPRVTRKSIAIHAAVMFAAWLVYIIALYPGSMNWDTYYQITQWYPDAQIMINPYWPTQSFVDASFSDHHPVFDTLIFGLFAQSSEALFGTWNYGVFLYVVLQAVFTAVVFTVSVSYLDRLGAPYGLRSGIYIAYCVLPFFPFYAATMVKDSLFSPLFIIYLLMVCEDARTHGGYLSASAKRMIGFVAIGLLLALTKKPGMYVVLVSAVVLAIVHRKAWKAYLAQLAAVAAVMLIVMLRAIFPIFDVVPGGVQEALAMPFQQTARFVVLHPDEVTDSERSVIDALLVYDDVAGNYDPFLADSVKDWYRYYTATSADVVEYAKVYAAMGVRHPEVYLEAMAAIAAPYVNLSGRIEVYADTGDEEHAGSAMIHHPDSLQPLWRAVSQGYERLSQIPGLSILFSTGLYAFAIPSIVLVVLARRHSRLVSVFVPIALSLAVCFITPLFNVRYALPLVYAAPFLLGLCFSRVRRH